MTGTSPAGIYRGICVDNKDPEKLGRIRVQIPRVLGAAASGWAFPAWSLHDLTVWPEDRLPRAGQGVLVVFESSDKIVWLSAFGPQEFSDQRLDHQLDPVTGLPVAYETALSWNLPVLPEGIEVIVSGHLLSLSGVPSLADMNTVELQRHPPSADPPAADSPLWEDIDSAPLDNRLAWSLRYARPPGEEDHWYRASYAGDGLFWPAVTPPEMPPNPTLDAELTWQEFPAGVVRWQKTTIFNGTLFNGPLPLRDRVVHLYAGFDGGPLSSVATDTVDRLGKWSLNWTWPEDRPEALELRVFFLGDKDYRYLETESRSETIPAVEVRIDWTSFPSLPEYEKPYTLTGTVSAGDYGYPENIRTLRLLVNNRGISSFSADRFGNWSVYCQFTDPVADYAVVFDGSHPYLPASSPVKSVTIVTDTNTTFPTLPSQLTFGSGFTASGIVRDENSREVPKGIVQLMRLSPQDAGSWAAVAEGSVSNGSYSVISPAIDFLGDVRYRIDFVATPVYNASSSPEVSRTVVVAAPTLAKGSLGTTSATVSWAAVPSAADYQVRVTIGNDQSLYTQTETAYTASGLPPLTDCWIEVRTRMDDPGAGEVYSEWSNRINWKTGRAEVRKKGSFTYEANPTAIGTWRSPDGWSYNGNAAVQGYYSNSSYSGYGVITHNGAAFRTWVTNNHGSDVLANLSWNETAVYMYRNTESFTGEGKAVSIWWYVTASIAHQGGRPALAGGESTSGLERGTSGWRTLKSPWWGRHVLMNEDIGSGFGKQNSFAIYRNNSTEYSKYLTTSNGGRVRVKCSWNFATVSYVASRWN